MIASAVISLIYVLCAVVLFFGVREQDSELFPFTYIHIIHIVFTKISQERSFYNKGIAISDYIKYHNPTMINTFTLFINLCSCSTNTNTF